MSEPKSEIIDLIKLIREGDRQAFRKIYDHYVNMLFSYVVRYTKSTALAEDVVQEVFIKIWERRSYLDPQKSFKSYLFTITKNHIINLFDRYAKESQIRSEILANSEVAFNSTDSEISFAETQQRLENAIRNLPPQQKKIFELCKVEGLSYEEVAEQLDLSPGTVNVNMVRSLKYLREQINYKKSSAFVLMIQYLFS